MKALWLFLCLGLAACADVGVKTWYRADGSPNPPGQLEADKVACEQEMKRPQATRAAALDRDVVRSEVYETCMTRLGYTDSKTAVAPARPGAVPAGGAPGVAPPAAASLGAPPAAASLGGAPTGGAPPGSAPLPAPPAECRKVSDMRFWLPPCS